MKTQNLNAGETTVLKQETVIAVVIVVRGLWLVVFSYILTDIVGLAGTTSLKSEWNISQRAISAQGKHNEGHT